MEEEEEVGGIYLFSTTTLSVVKQRSERGDGMTKEGIMLL